MVTKIRLFFLKRRWNVLQAQITVLTKQIRILQAEHDRKMNEEARRVARRKTPHYLGFSFFRNFAEEILLPISKRIKELTKQIRAIEDKKREVRFKIETVRAGSFSAVACREIPS